MSDSTDSGAQAANTASPQRERSRMSRLDAWTCFLLSVIVPLVLGDLMPAVDPMPDSSVWIVSVCEGFAVVGAFRLLRLGRGVLRVFGGIAFAIHGTCVLLLLIFAAFTLLD